MQEARSVRDIHRTTGIHRNTIKSYLERCKHSGKSYIELLALPDHELAALIHPPRNNHQADDRYGYLSGQLERYANELSHPHVTKQGEKQGRSAIAVVDGSVRLLRDSVKK